MIKSASWSLAGFIGILRGSHVKSSCTENQVFMMATLFSLVVSEGIYHNYNIRCHQLRQCCHHDTLGFSVVLCCTLTYHRADSRFAPSQWETALLCNDVFHWLGASLESALFKHWFRWQMETKLSTVQYLSQYWPSSILIQCACVCTYFHVSYFCRCGSYVCFINRLLFYQDQVILLCKHQMKCDRTSRIINVFKRRIIYCGVLQWVHYWATDESNYLVKCFFKYIIYIYVYEWDESIWIHYHI